VIVLGALVALWGALVLGLARPLHSGWKDMHRKLRGAGYDESLFGTRWLASDAGLRGMRRAGLVALAAGLALVVAGGVRAFISAG
jgi:hypothetical protein